MCVCVNSYVGVTVSQVREVDKSFYVYVCFGVCAWFDITLVCI